MIEIITKNLKSKNYFMNRRHNKLRIAGLLFFCTEIFQTTPYAAIYSDFSDYITPPSLSDSVDELSKEGLRSYESLLRSTSEPDEYSQELLLAFEAWRNKHIEEALERAKKLHDLYPKKIDPINLMGVCYISLGQLERAKAALEKVLVLKPNDPVTTRNLAKIDIQIGNVEQAKDLLQPILKKHPGDEEAAMVLAEIEVKQGNQAAAIHVLEQAMRINPDALTARVQLASEYLQAGELEKVLELTHNLNNLQVQDYPSFLELRGKAQMLKGDITDARNTFEEWVDVAPKSAPAHFYYGDSLVRSGEAENARRQLYRALEIDPTFLPARIAEVKMLVHSGELESAKKALFILRKDFGDRIEVLNIEGWLALSNGDYATAEQRLSLVSKQRPSSDLTILLAWALWGQGKQDQAITILQDWLKSNPSDKEVLQQLADRYLILNRTKEAIATYKKIVEIQPEQVSALNNLAWLNRDKDPMLAMNYIEQAFKLAPQDPQVLDTLGMLTLDGGNLADAFNLVSKAAALSPSDIQIQFHLGYILVKQKRIDEAREVLESLVRQAPNTQQGKEAKSLLNSL